MSNGKLISIGVGLIGLAVTPTPDDITIISPTLQLIVGAILILKGVSK